MIKIFIISALLLLPNCAFATYNLSNLYGADKLYLKGIIGGSKLQPIKEIQSHMKYKTKHESNLSPSIGIGIGYKLSPLSRAELVAQIHLPYFNIGSSPYERIEDGSPHAGVLTTNRKSNIQTLMANYYFTVIDKPDYDIFIGAGIGVARIKEKINYAGNDYIIRNGLLEASLPNVSTTSTKMVNNFTYTLSVGTSIKLQQNVDFELVYNWRDFGKTKPTGDENGRPTKNRYHGHDYTVGLRFAI